MRGSKMPIQKARSTRQTPPVAHFTDPGEDLLSDLDQDKPRGRSISQEKSFREGAETLFSFPDTTQFSSLVSTHQIIDGMYPLFGAIWRSIRKRIKGYVVTAGALAIILISGGQFKDRQLRSLTSTEWFYVVNLFYGLNCAVAIVEDVLFFLFSVIWWGPHDDVFIWMLYTGPLEILSLSAH
jgi:hypothetical protein